MERDDDNSAASPVVVLLLLLLSKTLRHALLLLLRSCARIGEGRSSIRVGIRLARNAARHARHLLLHRHGTTLLLWLATLHRLCPTAVLFLKLKLTL